MKKGRLSVMVLLLLFTVGRLKAQSDIDKLIKANGFEQLIRSGPADASKLVNAYAHPLLKGLGLGMNSGWTNTAKTLDLLHFDLRVTVTAVFVPSSDQSFNVTQIGLSSHLRPADANNVMSPTFSGNTSTHGAAMNLYDDNGNKLTSFDLPGGVLESVVPAPQLQVTIGLIPNTDFSLRAMPKIKISHDFGSVSMIGFSIKHDIIQDFAGIAGHPIPFDLAFAFGYNRLTYKKSLSLQPEFGAVPENPQQLADFTRQAIFGHFDNYLFQVILSKQFSFFTPYVAAGYSSSKTTIGLKGNYPVITGLTDDGLTYTTYTDPIHINLKYVSDTRVDMGFQLKFPLLRLYASYSLSEHYSSVNAGIGLGL